MILNYRTNTGLLMLRDPKIKRVTPFVFSVVGPDETDCLVNLSTVNNSDSDSDFVVDVLCLMCKHFAPPDAH